MKYLLGLGLKQIGGILHDQGKKKYLIRKVAARGQKSVRSWGGYREAVSFINLKS